MRSWSFMGTSDRKCCVIVCTRCLVLTACCRSAPSHRPWDLVFADQQTRDIFAEIVQSINKSVVIKDCALERTPLWVPDSQTNQCMRYERAQRCFSHI